MLLFDLFFYCFRLARRTTINTTTATATNIPITHPIAGFEVGGVGVGVGVCTTVGAGVAVGIGVGGVTAILFICLSNLRS